MWLKCYRVQRDGVIQPAKVRYRLVPIQKLIDPRYKVQVKDDIIIVLYFIDHEVIVHTTHNSIRLDFNIANSGKMTNNWSPTGLFLGSTSSSELSSSLFVRVSTFNDSSAFISDSCKVMEDLDLIYILQSKSLLFVSE